jgi:hypothetical protein
MHENAFHTTKTSIDLKNKWKEIKTQILYMLLQTFIE